MKNKKNNILLFIVLYIILYQIYMYIKSACVFGRCIPTGLIPCPSLDCSAVVGQFINFVDPAIPRVLYRVLR